VRVVCALTFRASGFFTFLWKRACAYEETPRNPLVSLKLVMSKLVLIPFELYAQRILANVPNNYKTRGQAAKEPKLDYSYFNLAT